MCDAAIHNTYVINGNIMNDIRSFLRYVLPGISFAIFVFLFFLISNGKETVAAIKPLLEDKGLGGSIVALFASGAVGYIFSIIYFAWAWGHEQSHSWAQDHRQLVVAAIKREYCLILGPNGQPLRHLNDIDNIDQREAWAILNSIWFTLKGTDKSIQELDAYIDRLCNIMHGLGTTFVATIFAYFAWFIIYTSYAPSPIRMDNIVSGFGYILVNMILTILLSWVLGHQQSQVKKDIERIVNSSLLTALMNRKQPYNNTKWYYLK